MCFRLPFVPLTLIKTQAPLPPVTREVNTGNDRGSQRRREGATVGEVSSQEHGHSADQEQEVSVEKNHRP